MIYTLKNDLIEVKISSLGAELVSAKAKDGFEYVWSGKEWGDHSPLLFPLCGRIKDCKYTYDGKEYEMKGHGFAKFSEFECREQSDTALTLSLSSSADTRKQYPFEFELVARFTLDESQLRAEFSVRNGSDVDLPYMLGWHPGFNMEGSAPLSRFYLDFGGCNSLVLNPLQNGCFVNPNTEVFPLSDGKYFINNAEIAKIDTYILRGTENRVVLSGANGEHSVELSWSDNLPYFCVWKAPEEEARFICLEPWSDVPGDGEAEENFNTRAMSRLAPGESAAYSYVTNFN